jgi:antitoxin ParD1/3/4
MANVEKLSITLSKDMVEAIRDAVDSGDYATTSEVIRDALRGWRFRRITVDPSDTATIRKLVEEGMNSGPSVDAEEVFDRLERKYTALAARREREHGSKGEARKIVAGRRKRS